MELDLDNISATRVLGRGATGTVFLATDRSSPSSPPFALKVVEKHNPSAKPGAERRALWELSVHLRLLADPHPFLPRLIGHAETPELLAYATPFCPGGDLNTLRHSLSPDRVFSASAIRFYLSQLVSALSHLHSSLRIAFRDLKPENVLLQSSGHVLLTDFDLSRHLPNPRSIPAPAAKRNHGLRLKKGKSARVSPVGRQRGGLWGGAERSNSFVGTEEYVAPEVVKGEGHGFAVDWWALGVLAYEMAYGRTPFRGRNRKETFRNVLTKKAEFVGKQRWELTDLIAGLLEKEPERRLGYFGGAEEVKAHPFFDGLIWEMLAEVGRAPFLAGAEEIEEGEGRLTDVGFDVRDYFEKLRRRRQEEAGGSPESVSSFAEF